MLIRNYIFLGILAVFCSGPGMCGASLLEPSALVVSVGNDVMPTGPSYHPLKLDENSSPPVFVPEPVWASILAATAVIFLGRKREK